MELYPEFQPIWVFSRVLGLFWIWLCICLRRKRGNDGYPTFANRLIILVSILAFWFLADFTCIVIPTELSRIGFLNIGNLALPWMRLALTSLTEFKLTKWAWKWASCFELDQAIQVHDFPEIKAVFLWAASHILILGNSLIKL